MQQDVAMAVLERSSDLTIVFANTVSQRQLTPNEWAAYDSALALFQQIATGFEITIDQQIIQPAVQSSQEPPSDGDTTGESYPE